MKDKVFKIVLIVVSSLIILFTVGTIYALVSQSIDTFRHFGFWHFLNSTDWDPIENKYGALPFIIGTLSTAVLSLIICIPFSLAVMLFNGEFFRNTKIAFYFSSIVDLLAGIPSIVYGLWGFYVLRPYLIDLGVNSQGLGILLSSIVLAIMIIPYASSLSTEFIAMVPNILKEGAYSLGATRYEVIRHVHLSVANSGILASYILAFGRALGETMAVTMLIGNSNNIPLSLRDTGNTMASIIANQFGEADGLKLSSLFAIGLLLFLITAIVNLIAKYTIKIINK